MRIWLVVLFLILPLLATDAAPAADSFTGLYEGEYWNPEAAPGLGRHLQVYGPGGRRKTFACKADQIESLRGKIGLQITVRYHREAGSRQLFVDEVLAPEGEGDRELNFSRERAFMGHDPEAADRIGLWYEKGKRGLPIDPEQAAQWYRTGAEPPFPEADRPPCALAMLHLGDCYRRGFGVTQDGRQAFFWFQKAVDAGHAGGIEAQAECWRDGVGVPVNRQKAAELFRKAASFGRKSASRKLKEMGEL